MERGGNRLCVPAGLCKWQNSCLTQKKHRYLGAFVFLSMHSSLRVLLRHLISELQSSIIFKQTFQWIWTRKFISRPCLVFSGQCTRNVSFFFLSGNWGAILKWLLFIIWKTMALRKSEACEVLGFVHGPRSLPSEPGFWALRADL